MPTFQPKSGMAPQIEVPTNITADSRIVARRPKRSASAPQTTEPVTVPQSAANGSQAAISRDSPYSSRMPGTTNPRLAGFMTSMTSASVSTAIRRQCAGPSGASSGAVTVAAWAGPASRRGSRPQAAAAMPAQISAMPHHISASISMPTRRKPLPRPI